MKIEQQVVRLYNIRKSYRTHAVPPSSFLPTCRARSQTACQRCSACPWGRETICFIIRNHLPLWERETICLASHSNRHFFKFYKLKLNRAVLAQVIGDFYGAPNKAFRHVEMINI